MTKTGIRIEVKEGKSPWIAGVVTILFGILYGVLCTIYPNQAAKGEPLYYLLVYPAVVLMILAGVWLCLVAKNRKLVVEDTALCYRNCFDRKLPFALSDIAYCRTAMENGGNRDYLTLYTAQGKKLCKLDYNMHNSIVFFQYLIDNQVKIECSEKSDDLLKGMLNMSAISQEAIPAVVNAAYLEAKELIRKWIEENKRFGVEWKTGIVAYLENEISEKKQLWEQTSCHIPDSIDGKLPERYIIAIEGYLLKDGEFVVNKKGRAVCFFVPIISVAKSLKVGEALKIGNYKGALDELSAQLCLLADSLPKNRYHTEALVLNHELKDSL